MKRKAVDTKSALEQDVSLCVLDRKKGGLIAAAIETAKVAAEEIVAAQAAVLNRGVR